MIDPASLRYTTTHEWVHLDGDVATIGISRFAVDQLTDLMMVDLPAIGTKVVQGKGFGEIESVKSVNDLYAPVGGEVVAVNDALKSDLGLLGDDPYNKGWLIKVKVDDDAPVAKLLDHDAYWKHVEDATH